MDLWVREARIFKYGSGTGSNFSKLRGEGETLSGGGRSSGLMSFLKIGDRAAGAIKSGGTTRRAAKMVTVDIDHPDIEAFIDWKVIEEQKVAALVAGSKLAQKHLNLIMAACHGAGGAGRRALRPDEQPRPEARDPRGARARMIPENYVQRVIQFAQQGYTADRFPDLRHRLGQRRLSHRLGPELEQLGPRHQRLPRARREGRRLAPDPAHRRQGGEDPAGARAWERSPTPPGHAPILACNSTRRSTTGTPARRAAASTRRIRARNTCSSTTRRAISPRSTCSPSARADGTFDIAGLRARGTALDDHARDLGADGAVPVARDRASCPTSTGRSASAIANLGGLLMACGPAL